MGSAPSGSAGGYGGTRIVWLRSKAAAVAGSSSSSQEQEELPRRGFCIASMMRGRGDDRVGFVGSEGFCISASYDFAVHDLRQQRAS